MTKIDPHVHAHGPEAQRRPLPLSLLAQAAIQRVGVVALGLALLWLCVLWAIALP